MALSRYWADKYIENQRTAQEAMGLIKPVQRVFIGSSCGEPQHLVRELSEASDYIKDLTIVAVVGEFGFGKVIGVGEYLVDPATYEAETAFSISKPYQKKGLGKILLNKLAYAARDNGIRGLMAYTSPQNKGMIKLFKTLPYKIDSFFDGDTLQLRCRFDQPL